MLNDLAELAHAQAVASGFYADARPTQEAILARIALIHSELSEAVEALRDGYVETYHVGDKPEGFPVEIADAVIRIGDLCGWLGIDLDAAVEAKMEFNRTRPFRHGKAGL